MTQGGDFIAEDTIRRRYYSGLKNFVKFYLPIADSAIILDNSMADPNKLIAKEDLFGDLKIEDASLWKEMLEFSHAK